MGKGMNNTLLKGTLILSGAVMISKLLGLIYLIPLKHIIGYEGITLLMKGYIPYTVILSLATLGIPMAVSKYVSKYNSIGQYSQGKRLLSSSFKLLLGTGMFFAIVVYLLAPMMAEYLKDPEALWPIRAVSAALIVVPAMAVLRGYFQGWQSMEPTGVSQVIEQLIRVLFILIISILLIQIGISVSTTVAVASLGALLGAIGGMLVLFYYWRKKRADIHEKVLASPKEKQEQPIFHLYKELLRYAIPISIVSLAIPLFQLVDWLMYNRLLIALGIAYEVANNWFALLTGTVYKIMMIPVSLATAFALAVMPSVTSSFSTKEHSVLKDKINQSVSVLLYFMFPASVGLFVLAAPLHYTIYNDLVGVEMLKWYASSAIFIALYTLTAAILQGIEQTKWSVIWLGIALLVKGITTPIFTHIFIQNGAIVATTIGFAVGVLGNLWTISRHAQWSVVDIFAPILKMVAAALVMGVVVYGSEYFLTSFLSTNFIHYLIRLLVGTSIGLIVYLALTWKMPWIHSALGRFKKRRAKVA